MKRGTAKSRVLAWFLAIVMVITFVPVNTYAETTQEKENDEQKNEVAPKSETVTFMNDGYPYGKDMSSDSVTLVMDVEGTTATYQWQKSDSENGTFTDITNAASKEYTETDLTTGTWYRCLVNGQESKAVETVKSENGNGLTWTNPGNDAYKGNWYISNGKMAYMVKGTVFNVTGLHTKNGEEYMLCTSYAGCWSLFSDNEPNPQAGSTQDVSLDALRVAFDEKDNFNLKLEADLAEGQQAFAFGCDTQLGDQSTSGDYADTAALKATVKNGKLEQVAMVGAATIDEAKDDDPAFVIAPITEASYFWIGNFGSRKCYTYNTDSSDTRVTKRESIGGAEVATLFESGDSGMTMSWTNIPSGGTVKFRFSVGSVADTGAVSGKVDYRQEKLVGLDPNTTYEITSDGENYIITSDMSGAISLSGQDNKEKEYDFTGKNITVAKQGSQDTPSDIEVAGRPDKPSNPSDYDKDTESNPSDAEKIEIVETTENTITISPISGQDYSYSTDGGKTWTAITDANKDDKGNYVLGGLSSSEGKVQIRTRKSASSSVPASEWSDVTEVTLKPTIKVSVNAWNGTYDGMPHSITITPQAETEATVEYSTNENMEYSSVQPEFTSAGEHIVYYRVTASDYYPLYGSAKVVIVKKTVTVEWGEKKSFEYNGRPQSPIATIAGVIDEDECSPVVSGAEINVGNNYRAYVSEFSGNQADNYYLQGVPECSYEITKANYDAPVVSAIDETIRGKADGKIEGLTTDMEYRNVNGQAGVSADISNPYIKVTDADMTFAPGTYEVRYNSENCSESEAVTVTINEGRLLKISVPDKKEGYTLTINTLTANWHDNVTLTFALNNGYSKTDNFAVKVNGQSINLDDNGIYVVSELEDDAVVTVEGVADITPPTGTISIRINGQTQTWSDFTDQISFDLNMKDNEKILIEADNTGSGLESIQYYVSDKKMTESEARALDEKLWKDGTENISVPGGQNGIIYIKLTDKAGNVTIICTNGIKVEHTWPEEWTEVKKATATEPGKKEKICTGCRAKKYEIIPAIGAPADDKGNLTKEAEVSGNCPIQEATLNNEKKELLNDKSKIFNEQEKAQIENGSDARVWLEISNTSIDSLSQADKTAVEEKIKEVMGDKTGAIAFNADLYKEINGQNKTKIPESGVMLKITIKIPDEICNNNASITREYKIVRLHNGQAEIISGTFDANTNEFTFETNQFSTYVIVYEDHPVSSSGNGSYISSSKKLDTIERLIKDELAKLPTENISSKDDIESVIKKVIEASDNKAVSYEITDFVKVDPTTKSEGKVSGTVKLTLNGVSKTVTFSYTLKKLTDNSGSSDTVKETKFPLIASAKAGNKKVKLSWEKVTGATGYEIYGCVCDGSKNFKKVADTKKLSATQKNLNNKKSYKYYVRAYKIVDGKKVYLKKSPTLHVSLKNNKSTNVKNIKTTKSSYTLNVGKKAKICATIVKEDKNKKLLAHVAELRYYSSNTSVATVSKDGTITAKAAGTCTIYVVANNGTYKKIKVTVK